MLHMLDKWYIAGMTRFHRFKTEERGDVNIVSIVVLCGIVIFLAIIFRKELEALITGVMEGVTKQAKEKKKKKPTV